MQNPQAFLGSNGTFRQAGFAADNGTIVRQKIHVTFVASGKFLAPRI